MSDKVNKTINPNLPADFQPERQPFTPLSPFRYWCQKVLPLVYDDSLSYYELLCKVVDYLNNTMEDVSNLNTDMTSLFETYEQLQEYVNNYFSSLDVQTEINNKLDAMVSDGTFTNIINEELFGELNDKIDTNITNTNKNTQDIAKNTKNIELLNYLNIKNLIGSTNVLIGDSLGQGNTSNLECGWCYKIKKMLGEKTYFNASSGKGFATSRLNFNQMLLQTIETMSEEDKINTKNVVILGGLNDVTQGFSPDEIGQGVTDCYNTAIANFPNATIFIAPLNTFVSLNKDIFMGYNAICLYATSLGATTTDAFIDGISGHQQYEFNNDRTHLTDGGYNWLAWNILNVIQNKGVFLHSMYNDNDIQFFEGFTSVGSYVYVNGGKVSVQLGCAVSTEATSGNIAICVLPTDVKPNEIRYVYGNAVSNSISKPVILTISLNGAVSIYQYSGEKINEFYCNFEYEILPKTQTIG